MEEYHENYYVNLMDKNPNGFLKMLNRNIIKGDKLLVYKEETLKMMRVISRHPLCQQLLSTFRDDHDEDCLIHNVAKFHQSHHVIKYLLEICPGALLAQRTDRFSGQTALHIVVTKGNFKATRTILKSAGNENDLVTLLHTKARGSLFANTVMMGELALSVAALALNSRITDLLMKFGARVSEQNSRGDTVFHSLIRFAVIHPEKLDSIINMIEHINSKLSPELVSLVWYNSENSDDLTALKLAAALGQVEIFQSILKLENVYCKLNHHDGLFDIYLFDITEIDTITQAEWERNKTRQRKMAEKSTSRSDQGKSFSFKQENKKKQPAAQSHRPALIHACPSVLDIICHLPTATAFRLMNVDVVNDVIKTKWTHYRKFYYLWLLIHFLLMSVITAYSVYKTDVINDRIYSYKTNGSNSDSFQTDSTTERFVFGTSLLCVVYAAPYLIYEAFRSFYFRQAWHLDVIHHNGLYRLMMMAMSVSLVVDSALFWIKPDNNYFLVVALLIGWTFMNFFLRALKIFSFFTVMLQKVLLGDMTRFSVIIIFQLIAFSFAMYITFLNTNPVPQGFENIGSTVLTMFKLMLGLTDIEILYDARHPWMAIALFVTCVLVTYVLLINSLIALMSQTCALVSEDRRMQWELQRLSVIHLVETMLLPRWRHLHKPGLKARRYDLDSKTLEWRCFNEITSIQTTYTDGAALFRRKSMIRTIGFGDSGMSPMAPFIDRFRVGRSMNQMNTLPLLYQSPGSLREEVATIAEEDYQELDQDSSDGEESTLQFQPKISRSNPTPIAVRDRLGESFSHKGSSNLKQTMLHSSTDNVRGELTTKKKRFASSDDNIFSSSSSSSALGDGDRNSESKEKSATTSHIEKKKNQNHRDFLQPEGPPVPPPRKRHNSERVNRKTQTVNQGDLSHSYPTGSLSTPLRQNRSSVGEQVVPPIGSSAAVVPDTNPRIVYVVPSSVFPQQSLISNMADPRQFPTPQDNEILQQISAVPEIRLQRHDSRAQVGESPDSVYAQVNKPRSFTPAMTTPLVGQQMSGYGARKPLSSASGTSKVAEDVPQKTVQKLDIDILHSSA